MWQCLFEALRKFSRCQQGVAYIEFAFSLTLLLILFEGTVELTRYVLLTQKMEKTVSTLADVVTQSDPTSSPISSTVMSQLMGAVPDMMNPFAFGTSGIAIVTDITQAGSNNPVVNWQYCSGSLHGPKSKIGTTIGGAATLTSISGIPPAASFTMNAGEEVLISEVYYQYSPLLPQTMIGGVQLYRSAIFMPRLGALSDFSSSCTYP